MKSELTFAVETLAQAQAEVDAMFPAHYEELALDKDRIKLDLDWDKARDAEMRGILILVTARANGILVGYFFGLLMTHLHYKSAGLMCYTDNYYLLPQYRKGMNGAALLVAVEKLLRSRGVVKFYITTKVHSDVGPLLEAMGMRLSDKLYTKMLT